MFISYPKMFIAALIGFCVILAGCSEALEDSENVQAEDDSIASKVSNVSSCYSDEEYSDEEDICKIPLTCDNPLDCAVFGEDIVRRLEAEYGSFVNLETIEMNERDEANSKKDEKIIAKYRIKNNQLIDTGSNSDDASYKKLWKDFAWVIPAEERKMLTEFSIFTHVDTLAYVLQDDNKLENWSLGINVKPSTSPNDTIGTLIHEFGHLLMLNIDQIDPYIDKAECSTYYLEDGCSKADSYIYAFQTEFWPETEYEYDKDTFVSEYAATNSVEDIAESWMNFVLSDKPKGKKIADQKVLFFYQYDELIMLRAELLSRVATFMERNG